MRSKNILRAVLPMLLFFSPFPVFAAPSVTFEILATFDYPGAVDTIAGGINDRGDVAGSYFDASGNGHGFVRLSNGRFSAPIIDPNDPNQFTEITGINNRYTLCGFGSESFLLSGRIFTYVTTSAFATTVYGVNDAGNFCGYTSRPDASFVTIGGTATLFRVPVSSYNEAHGINSLDQCVGWYVGSATFQAGFRRDADGTLTYPIIVPGATNTMLFGINDSGSMVGEMVDMGSHAVFFEPTGRATVYDYPRATSTTFRGINNNGLICGWYVHLGTHAFIARVK